ncbi:MAG: arsenate reductase ArsC [Desulfobaccales bacterium]
MDRGEQAKPVVLFLCTGNTARSQMAEAFLKKYAGERFEVHSAGYEPKPINPYTIKVMEEAGFDLGGQYAKGVKDFLGKVNIRYLIIVCGQAEKTCPKLFPGVLARLFWPFEDPAALSGTEAEKLAKFRAIRDQIDRRIRAWLEELD